jgi:hypothetical protein
VLYAEEQTLWALEAAMLYIRTLQKSTPSAFTTRFLSDFDKKHAEKLQNRCGIFFQTDPLAPKRCTIPPEAAAMSV